MDRARYLQHYWETDPDAKAHARKLDEDPYLQIIKACQKQDAEKIDQMCKDILQEHKHIVLGRPIVVSEKRSDDGVKFTLRSSFSVGGAEVARHPAQPMPPQQPAVVNM